MSLTTHPLSCDKNIRTRCGLKKLKPTAPTLLLMGLLFSHQALAQFIPFSIAQMQQAKIQAYPVGHANMAQPQISVLGQAVFQSNAQQVVSAPIGGVVKQLMVNPMQSVKAGQAIAVLYSPDVLTDQNALYQAQAQLKLAQNTLQRETALFKDGIIAQKRVFEAQAQVNMYQNDVQQKQRLLQFYGANAKGNLNPSLTVTAAKSGTVTQVNVAVGQQVAAGGALATIANSQELELALQVPSAQIKAIQLGQAVNVLGCTSASSAKITRIGQQLSDATQTQTVYANAPQGCVKANQYVQTKVNVGSSAQLQNSWLVPLSAVVYQQQKPYVFVVRGNGFDAITVNAAVPQGNFMAVQTAQLKQGQYVASSGLIQIKSVWQGMGAEQMPATTSNLNSKKSTLAQ